MSRTTLKINFLIMAGAFAGGLITGFFLTSFPDDRSRKLLKNKAGHISDWIEERRNKTGKMVRQLAGNLGRSVNGKLPDLFTATEDLHLKDDDLMN